MDFVPIVFPPPKPLFYTRLSARSGADRTAKNLDGKTALEVAELNEQQDVIDALKA